MLGRTGLLKATALALPFSLAAAAADAASIAETVRQQEELGTFAQAMEAAKFDQQLSGEGPYTLFAPTDQAFEQLPEGAIDELMTPENQAQLTRLLEHHVIEGEAIVTGDLLGQQSQIDPMSGDGLTVDGTSQVVLLVPTGRQQATARTPIAKESDMPMTEHQQQALQSEPAQEQQQTAPAGASDMPATEHQQQVIESQPGQGQDVQEQQPAQSQAQGQQGQQAGTQTPTAQGSDMPMTEHQQQALRSQPAQEQQQTAPADAAMPVTEHQRQVLAEEARPGEQRARVEGGPDLLREATVVVADIQADNGVIHVIDAVLLPPDVAAMLQQGQQDQN
jgi:uncharacterized surface protein with fasciclin (FAS1) repeats